MFSEMCSDERLDKREKNRNNKTSEEEKKEEKGTRKKVIEKINWAGTKEKEEMRKKKEEAKLIYIPVMHKFKSNQYITMN